MTTIFNVGYEKNQNRIDSPRGRSGNDTATHGSNQKDFSELLSDIEKRAAKSTPSEDLKQATPSINPSGEIVSNLNTKEHGMLEADLPPLIKNATAVSGSGSSGVIHASLRVNPVSESVKKISAVEKVEKPITPLFVSAKRVYPDRASIKPYSDYSRQDIKEIIKTAGKYHGVDPELSIAVAKAESSLRPHVVSKDGHETKGLFQLLDQTASEMLVRYKMPAGYDPFDPRLNAHLGVGYLRKLHDIFSRETFLRPGLKTVPAKSADDLEKLAIAAFNAGEGNVAKAQAKALRLGKDPTNFESIEPHLPASTRAYVTRVAELRAALKRETPFQNIA